MINDSIQLNNNFSLEESSYNIVVLKYKGQEVLCLHYDKNDSKIQIEKMFPALDLIRKYKEESI